jgi:acyl-CoA synthetase (NDP forming)
MTEALEFLFNPRSIAVVGASSNPTKLGGRPLHFLKTFGFRGSIFPVNPGSPEIQGLRAYSSVADIPGELDQAVVVVPAAQVEGVIIECAAKGVKIVQILSSGFGECGAEGRAQERRLVEIAKSAGMRLTGPNALGAVSPSNGLFATFSTSLALGVPPQAGSVSFATQSGAFGSCAYVMATQRGMGLARVIATGNEADVDVAECIAFLADDPETKVICAAIESCKDGDRLRSALRKAARAQKPVLIMKVGTTGVGAAAAATHTGALVGNDAIFDVVFRECGAWRARSIEEMIDLAYLLSVGRLPSDSQISLLTVSGGIGILMADAAVESGLAVSSLPGALVDRLKEIVPFATGNNPFDTTAQIAINRSAISQVGAAILAQSGFGSIALYLANNALNAKVFQPVKRELIDLKRQFPEKLVITVMPSDVAVRSELERAGIVVFEDPSRAIKAVANACKLKSNWNVMEEPSAIGRSRQASLSSRIDEREAKAILASFEIPLLDERTCKSTEEAGRAATEIGYPVVMKILSPDILHKTECGGVMLNLQDRASVEHAYEEICARARRSFPNAQIRGVLVAPMVHGGVETILGMHRDDVFGPMVMFGLGGVMVELFKDVGFASAPLSRAGAERLIESTKSARLLNGWRGSRPLDRTALVDAICRLSELAVAADDIGGVDINPFIVMERGAVALDAAITVRETIRREHNGQPLKPVWVEC